MKASSFSDLQALVASRAIVTLSSRIPEECDGYAETGMRARVIEAGEDCDGYYVRLDFSAAEAHNRPLETSSFWDESGKPTLTAREAGYYYDVEKFYIEGAAWQDYLTPVPGVAATLMSMYSAQNQDASLSYQGWLESMAAQHLGLLPAADIAASNGGTHAPSP